MPKNTCARSCQTLACMHSNLPQSPQRDIKKTADSIAYSTRDVHQINTIPPLLTLPPELLLKILGNLQDLEDLFSTILACRRIFDVFREAQSLLIEPTFAKSIRLKTDWGIYRVLIQFSQIIQRDIVRRAIVRRIFETGWEIFRQRHQEELLIPFGRALAWSYVLDERRADANLSFATDTEGGATLWMVDKNIITAAYSTNQRALGPANLGGERC